MFRRPRPEEITERTIYTKGERAGSAFAHATPLLIGLPLVFITPLVGGNLFMALVPCPIVSYVISRSFRHRQSVWGAFQAMQAAIVQLILLVLVFSSVLVGEGGPAPAGEYRLPPGLSALPLRSLGRLGHRLGLRFSVHIHKQFRGPHYRRPTCCDRNCVASGVKPSTAGNRRTHRHSLRPPDDYRH